MNKLIISFILTTTLLSGCSSIPIGTQIVKIPIATKCDPSVKVTPITHPFDMATKEMSLYEKFQLLLAEDLLLTGQNKELTAALSECTK